ncbi:ferredoxin [Minwuia sp.]|uniref:ferredoxin n=1 Tax=Minwuia sp. TaxID=2493630 RepID=UPI003A95485F
MKIRVNPDKCQGHNRCYAVAPDLFEVDDVGNASAANGGVVPDDMKDDAKLAIDNCPEFAIEIVEE